MKQQVATGLCYQRLKDLLEMSAEVVRKPGSGLSKQ